MSETLKEEGRLFYVFILIQSPYVDEFRHWWRKDQSFLVMKTSQVENIFNIKEKKSGLQIMKYFLWKNTFKLLSCYCSHLFTPFCHILWRLWKFLFQFCLIIGNLFISVFSTHTILCMCIWWFLFFQCEGNILGLVVLYFPFFVVSLHRFYLISW